jgi:cytoskeletal protein RodZ
MKTVGETLRSAREQKALDLDFVSDALKIRVKYLEALEQGNYDIFPSQLYARGFLKNYAKFLGLDEGRVMALYRREYTSSNKQPSLFTRPEPVIRSFKFVLKPGHIITGFTILVVVAIAAYLIYEYRSFSAPPSLYISTPVQNQIVNSSTIVVNGTTANGSKVTINGSSIGVIGSNGSFSMDVALHAGLNQITISASNTLDRTNTIERNVIYDEQGVNATTTPTVTGEPLSGKLTIMGDSALIKLVTDGNTIINWQVLSSGTVKTFSANTSITIETGRASATELTVNGQTITLSGSTVVVQKTITLGSNNTLVVQ